MRERSKWWAVLLGNAVCVAISESMADAAEVSDRLDDREPAFEG